MGAPLTKTTVLEGYYATGDYECFCFDRHPSPRAHHNEKWPEYKEREALVADALGDESKLPDPWRNWDFNDCRVYPGDLMPEGMLRERRGKWTVTVTFEPDSDTGP